MREGDGGVAFALRTEQYSPLFHLRRTFIALESPFCFCQPLSIKASALLEKWCHSALSTAIHSVVSHCMGLLCVPAFKCVSVCAVGQ